MFVLEREDGTRVPGRELPAFELRLDRIREGQEAERVRDGRPTLPHALRDFLLGQGVDVHQVVVRLGFLERGKVLALQILDERELQPFLRPRLPHDDRHGLEPRALCRL